jgi:hypothetical protein
MMELEFSPGGVRLSCAGVEAGYYRHADEFKPHVHPLRTPRGHGVTSCSPHDHKHHKALMYALRAEDVNFWEESTTQPGEVPGRQRHLAFRDVVSRGPEAGFVEDLRWEACDGALSTFDEVRTVRCRHEPGARAFVWTWETRLTALRDVRLVQSQWSHGLGDGSKVNYHGLGIRFRRDFGGMTRNHELNVDGAVFRDHFQQQMGVRPRSVTFVGSLDETWPVERAGVTFTQAPHQDNALYVMEDYIPFMALGPTNRAPMTIPKGGVILERYTVKVFDL